MKKLLALFLVLAVSLFAESFTVNFKCNMSVQVKKGLFTIGADKLVVRGSFNGWKGDADSLTKGANDTIYTLAKSIDRATAGADETINFKFVKISVNAPDDWESDPNRQLTIPAGVNSVDYYAWFNRDSIFVNLPPKDIKVTFKCNMEYEIGSGRFNPPDDSISVNGSFNGWSSKKDVLDPDFLNTNLYIKEVIIKAVPTDKIEYKFWYEPGTWESVDNRKYEFTQEDYDRGEVELQEVYFNNGSLETMTAGPVAVKLTVYTKDAVAANGTKFTNVNTVHVAGSAKPLSWPGGGWPTTDAALMIPLYNDGTHGDAAAGDDIFTTIITFPIYTVLNVEYKYSINFGTPDNSGVNDNEGSVGGNHILKLKSNMISCTVVDTFGSNLGKPSFIKDEVLGVQVVDNVKPASYVLEQNYPNPFNPTTNIKFALTNAGFTTLKVYDMLGREVATLVNENLAAGTYNVNFDAANLTTGIYVYELRSGSVKLSKKMMLVK